MQKWIAVLAAAVTGVVAEASAQGMLGPQTAVALTALVAGLVTEYARRLPTQVTK